jgi:hypothetical protein
MLKDETEKNNQLKKRQKNNLSQPELTYKLTIQVMKPG